MDRHASTANRTSFVIAAGHPHRSSSSDRPFTYLPWPTELQGSRIITDKCYIFLLMFGAAVRYITISVIVLFVHTDHVLNEKKPHFKPKQMSRMDKYQKVSKVSAVSPVKSFTMQLVGFWNSQCQALSLHLLSDMTKQLCPLQSETKITHTAHLVWLWLRFERERAEKVVPRWREIKASAFF